MRWFVLALALATSTVPASSSGEGVTPLAVTKEAEIPAPQIPDVELFDQDGRKVRLPELIRGKTVAINFVFTTCSTVCSPLTAIFSRVQSELGPHLGKEVHLLSITLDPAVDTPQRLQAWASQFGRRSGWTFVTGKPADVNAALRAFGAWVANKETHTPMVLIGNEPAKKWTRLFGLSSPSRIVAEIDAVRAPPPAEKTKVDLAKASAAYFTDLEVVDQHGRTHRFYTDLLRGQKVLIHFVFASCKTACPAILEHVARVQEKLGDHVGKDVRILTLTVDPANDSPEALRKVAERVGARPGWYFLTGTQANVETILRRLGGWTEDPQTHSTALFLGDLENGIWLKTIAMRPAEEIAHAVLHLDDPLPGAVTK